jgi:hypothetical protein
VVVETSVAAAETSFVVAEASFVVAEVSVAVVEVSVAVAAGPLRPANALHQRGSGTRRVRSTRPEKIDRCTAGIDQKWR